MIIFIYGEDKFRSRQKLDELRAKFQKDVDTSGESVSFLDGEKLDIKTFASASGAGSLFAAKRMIIVDDISKNKSKTAFKEIKEYLEKNEASDNIIIFIDSSSGKGLARNILWKYLLAQKFVQHFEPLSATSLASWIRENAQAKGGLVTQAQAMKIGAMLSHDLFRVDNELNKLIAYKKGDLNTKTNVKIEDKDIENMLVGQIDENIFALTDAISAKRKDEALRLLENELELGTNSVYLMHMIIRQFRILLQVKQALDMGETQRTIASSLKLHPFVVSKSLNQVRSFDFAVLKNIYRQLIDLDKDLKTGRADFKTSIALLISKL